MNDSKDNSGGSGLDELRALGREIGNRIKDAGSEVSEDMKEAWHKLQPHVSRAEVVANEKGGRVAEELAGTTEEVVHDIKDQLQKLKAKLDA